MCVWWCQGVSMRVWCMVAVLIVVALWATAEPAPHRYRSEWRAARGSRELARPLRDLLEPESAAASASASEHRERRRAHNSKRASYLPAEIPGSQTMLRASRSNRPYDVPQIASLGATLHNNIGAELTPPRKLFIFNGSSEFCLHGITEVSNV
ncbi:hypothetical protein RR48_07382 [Papilio machaon]|uniref:Uncharacterized protein n=1 Tax=Papilio machaon TaxID=76193 RepID=A0A194RPK4_PAPMA|nr:hypothetical protein RR48_07382 [Papilio machaon]